MDKKVSASIRLAVTPDLAIKAFVNSELLKAWWGVEQSLIVLEPGGIFTLAWNVSINGFKYVTTGIIQSYSPGSILRLENMQYLNPDIPILGPMELSIEAESLIEGCELNVMQSGYQSGKDWDWYYDAVVEAWPMALQSLKSTLEKDGGIG